MITRAQVEHFWRHGYVGGIDLLRPETCTRIWRHVEHSHRTQGPRAWQDPSDPLARLLRGLARHPGVLAVMRSVLGPDLMVRNAEIFAKEPGTQKHIEWHVDTHVRWPASRGMVNLWLALTPSNPETGCLQVLPDQFQGDPPYIPRNNQDLTFPRSVYENMDKSTVVALPLSPGQASLHHFRTPHYSGWTQTDQRRIGFVVRFLGADVTPEAAECRQATLVSGQALPGIRHREDIPLGWTSNRG
jgi:ectoine hydroxylase-related dioxygenase (phytanoyl-CoA dioxygenase family)